MDGSIIIIESSFSPKLYQMDIDNILDDSTAPGTSLIINDAIRSFLAESARWGKFLSIMGFVFLGLAVLGILLGGGALLASGMGGMFGTLGVLIYLLILGISAIPIYYLYNFSTKMQVALKEDNQSFFRDAFENHKSMFKFYGIFMAIILGLYALIFIVGLIAGLL